MVTTRFLFIIFFLVGCGANSNELKEMKSTAHFHKCFWEGDRTPFYSGEEENVLSTKTLPDDLWIRSIPMLLVEFERMKSTKQLKFEFSDYCIQYYPFISENGDYLVYLSAFCMDSGHPCDSYPVKVKDGGACFWNAKMNVSEKKLISMNFNGEA